MIISVPENDLLAGHAILFRYAPRRHIFGPDHGDYALCPQRAKGIIHAGSRGFGGITAAPQVASHVIADLHFILSLHILDGASAIADQFPGIFQQHGPETVSVALIAIEVPANPALHAAAVERLGIPFHRHRITEHRLERGGVLRVELPQKKPRRLQNQTFDHNSLRGSPALSFCISCHNSRTFKSRASGTTILISTISSPRLPSWVAEGTPFSRRRSFCPLCVPGGTRSCERPSMVGTSILVPSAASHAATGTVT